VLHAGKDFAFLSWHIAEDAAKNKNSLVLPYVLILILCSKVSILPEAERQDVVCWSYKEKN
jgi:hypothetical protein